MLPDRVVVPVPVWEPDPEPVPVCVGVPEVVIVCDLVWVGVPV